MYVANVSRSLNSKPLAGHGLATQVVGDNSSDVKSNYCNCLLYTSDAADE